MLREALPKLFLVLGLVAVLTAVACAAPAPSQVASPAPKSDTKPAASEAAKPAPSQAAKPAASPAPRPDFKPELLTAIIEGAKKEGNVHMMSGSRVEESQPFLDAFQKAFPFIKIKYTRIRLEDEFEAQLTALKAGQPPPADVLTTRQEILSLYEGTNFLEDLRPLLLPQGVDPDLIAPGGRFVFVGGNPQSSAYNPETVKAAEAPKTWEDLLDPKWKGRLNIDSSPSFLMGLLAAWGEEKTLDWLTKLMKNEPSVVRGHTQRLDALVAGEKHVTVGIYTRNVLEMKGEGAPLEPIIMNPVPHEPSHLEGVAIGAKNPNAARLFLAWITSKEGQKVYYDSRPPQGLPGYGFLEGHPAFAGAKWAVASGAITLKSEEYFAKFRKIMGLPGL